jgi:hypothetical protein
MHRFKVFQIEVIVEAQGKVRVSSLDDILRESIRVEIENPGFYLWQPML